MATLLTMIANFHRFCGVEGVTLLVGPDKGKFLIHKDILCEASRYFDAAFSSGFKEATEQTLALEQENPRIVESFINWIYTGRLNYVVPKDRTTVPLYEEPLELYLLADKYEVPKLRRQLVQYFYDLRSNHTLQPLATFTRLYDKTTDNDGLRKLFIDMMVWEGDDVWFRLKGWDEWILNNAEIAKDLVAAAFDRIKHPRDNPMETKDASMYFVTEATTTRKSTKES